MTEVKASLNSYRQSPRKVRLVASAIKGKSTKQAVDILSLIPNRAAAPLAKLVLSAVANAKGKEVSVENLVVKSLTVDGGAILYRRRPRSRGMANPIRKRTSHVTVVLAEKAPKK